ncbi:methyltransferase domain-containing protein [Sphingobium sp. DEHP117]|uniref:class I SAM-dependent methyltransferase n=1 Tax=Sphingobium sp. DEHP117 TaxID=2993436 RepID=UPI0027D64008|nr:methyltransferase domain-containing protein [Sphingobium sp. DEHP117]MDQ4420046.1 methyltransferase domain-containing protein [Sphingobium sp. DEHP117]
MITAQRVAKALGKHGSRALLAVRTALGARKDRHCPACGEDVAGFFRYGDEPAWGCPACGASPRERLVHHLLDTGRIAVPKGGAILHMAPNEASLVARLRADAGDYVPADLFPDIYKVPGVKRVDLMNIVEKARFDLFYASHVMEHVPDDAAVLRNIFTALKPGGEAWLIVPLWDRPTEDGSYAMPPRERERRFGQWDHVRQYGPDFADRIRAAGFDLDVICATDCAAGDVHRLALGEVLFRARRPSAGG